MDKDIARDAVLKKSEDVKGTEIKGYDFSKPFDLEEFIKSYGSTGFQASNLARAVEIIKKMRENKATIFLAFTSNMVTSGVRDVIAFLVKNKFVDVLVTTGGGVEEDIIKCHKPFILGRFDAGGAGLRKKGINRTGNIFIPNDRYIKFEKIMNSFLGRLLEKQEKEDKVFPVSEFIHELGKEVSDDNSICYWATKNNIPIFCPTLTDGSLGDMIYFFRKDNPAFKVDIASDTVKLNDLALHAEKSGVIILGSGPIKHHVSNANLFRDGSDYAVYINSVLEFDGSDSGARPEEAVAWGKIRPVADRVKVYGDATVLFPLIVAATFGKQ
jgi:deoxyhypusine synthase